MLKNSLKKKSKNKLNEEIIKNNNLKEENKKLLQENMKLKEELNKNLGYSRSRTF